MKCPTCHENTPDAWRRLVTSFNPDVPAQVASSPLVLKQVAEFELDTPRDHRVHFDWMYCANDDCRQLVIRGHDSFQVDHQGGFPTEHTDSWLVHPRHASRPLDPLISEKAEGLAVDFAEAVAVLDISHRMAAVLARSILADLLETYADLSDFRLVDRVDKFIEDTNRPFDLRQDLHYLREIADLSAHTKTNDQFEKIEISREEAEWTLTIIERLFDYFIVSPGKADSLRKGIDAKLEAAGRKPITPLAADPGVPLEGDGEEGTDREDSEGL